MMVRSNIMAEEKKTKRGRKSRQVLEGITVRHEMVSRHTALHEQTVLNILYNSMDKEALEVLMLTYYLQSKGIFEDNAGKILRYIWRNLEQVGSDQDNRYFFGNILSISKELGLSYATVQKIVKKLMASEGILELVERYNAYTLGKSAKIFLKSVEGNKQLILTFNEVSEEQLELFEGEKKEDTPKIKNNAPLEINIDEV